jgi:hypothetical protein
MKKFGEKNLDVPQNIEFGIVEVYRAGRSLLDIDVKDAIDALIRHYHAEEEQRTPPVMRLGDRAQMVFQSVQGMCEWRLGRPSFHDATPKHHPALTINSVTFSKPRITSLIICVTRELALRPFSIMLNAGSLASCTP